MEEPKKFSAKISQNGILFKTLGDILYNSFTRLVLQVTENNISSRMTNDRETMLFDFYIEREKMAHFHVTEPLIFGINIAHFNKVLSSIKKDDTLQLDILEKHPERLYITVTPPKENYADSGFVVIEKVQVLDIELPDGYDTPIRCLSTKFSKMWKEFGTISKSIRVSGNTSQITFQAIIDGILGKGTTYSEPDHCSEGEIIDDIYSINDMSKLTKLSNFGKYMDIYVKDGLPLKIQIMIGNLGSMTIFIHKKDAASEV